jgi:hypothetical protein
MKLIQLNSLLNILGRELCDFSENREDFPQRIDDLQALMASMQAILLNGDHP